MESSEMAAIMRADEERVRLEEEIITDLKLNRYQLEIAIEQVESLRNKRLDLMAIARQRSFNDKEISGLTGLSSKRVYELKPAPEL